MRFHLRNLALSMAFILTLGIRPSDAAELDALNLAPGVADEAGGPEKPSADTGWSWGRLAPPAFALASFIVPGAGQALNGDNGAALTAFGIGMGSQILYGLETRSESPRLPVYFPDTDQKASIFVIPASWAMYCSAYHAYKQAEAHWIPGTQIRAQPLAFGDLMLSPWQPENLLDWQNWATVATLYGSGLAVNLALPDDSGPDGPGVFEAKKASYGGVEMPVLAGFALNVLAGTLLAWQAGTGEEALFRGVLVDELERDTGSPAAAVALTSAAFGAAHIGGINQTSAARQFLGTAIPGAILGGYYLGRDHALAKSAAVHTYYDILAFTLNSLNPTKKGQNLLGVKFSF